MFFFSGCADDLHNRNIFDCGAGDAVIRFSVENVVLTRDTDTQDMESAVDHAYLLFYAEDASIDTGIPISAVRAEADADFSGKLKFKMPLRLQPNTDYQLLAIANADNYVPAGFNNFGEYIESWCGKASETEYSPMLLYHSAPITSESVENLPMSGGVEGNSVFRFSLDNGTYNISASLSFRRKVARIDVANIVKDGFKVEGVLLCNWRDAVSASSSNLMLGNSLGSVHGISSDDNSSDDKFIKMPDADESGIQKLDNMLYCFPSISYDSYIGDKESTALIIKAKFGSDAQSTYYRVNVGAKGNVSEVKANTKYLVTIQSVKGSGAPTPEEAYSSTESPIVLSVVEDWDLEVSNFAMDDKGNFIVVSRGFVEFEGNDTDNVEIGILTSKGLSWTAEYLPDNEDSASAFSVSSISNSIFICPNAANETENAFSGKCRVSATTSYGDNLIVDIALTQQPSEEKPYEPTIPDDMPFALIPESYDRVKIDHENRTIEIDGFDPDCFNSFIDIPFKVYVNPNFKEDGLSMNSTLQWPSEGVLSKNKHDDYVYCSNSFSTIASNIRVYSKTQDKELSFSQAVAPSTAINIKEGDIVYISIGAMGPDDPEIVRKVVLNCWEIKIEYDLIVRTKPTIIDDVIIADAIGKHWLIFDRNIQDLSNATFRDYIGIKSDGRKYQAYNYLSQSPNVYIPSKYKVEGESFFENAHELYCGVKVTFSQRNALYSVSTVANSPLKDTWLKRYEYADGQDCSSPFYDSSNSDKWNIPSVDILKLCASKMRVSKLRMFLISEVSVKDGKNIIPVCCYWPYSGLPMDNLVKYGIDNGTYGYYATNDTGNPESLIYIFCENDKIKTMEGNDNKFIGLTRLVRPLTNDELEDYKLNYLGYGSQLKLSLCHPDTYTSEGWLAK
ncbi:MAG: hypothetical protein K2L45_06875 [Muribaculaceae bacterium]|nr:hypothetical protein [Muribaculaceae bacterium]